MSRSISLSLSVSLSTALVSVLALSLAPACGTSDAAPPVAPNQVQPATAGNGKALCIEVFTRNRTCTDQYIPALVDMRAKYDQPAGIAAEVAADRDGVIAQAKTEWATDSQPAAIDATCTQIGANPGAFTQADVDATQACLAITDCAAYTACIMPLGEKRFAH
jgi:hypothetical protein